MDNRFTTKTIKYNQLKEVKINWLEDTKESLQELKIIESVIRNSEAFGTLVAKHKFAEKLKRELVNNEQKNVRNNTANL